MHVNLNFLIDMYIMPDRSKKSKVLYSPDIWWSARPYGVIYGSFDLMQIDGEDYVKSVHGHAMPGGFNCFEEVKWDNEGNAVDRDGRRRGEFSLKELLMKEAADV